MFGTLGFSELILILAIVFIIFGAGRLPQLGEGLGKALKGFKKEVHEAPPAEADTAAPQSADASPQVPQASVASAEKEQSSPQATPSTGAPPRPTAPYQPGPELTPGTTAALMAAAAPQAATPRRQPGPQTSSATPSDAGPGAAGTSQAGATPPTMEQRLASPPPTPRGVYPPVPEGAQSKPAVKRPSAIVNRDAVARVQAQQAAMRNVQRTSPSEMGLSPKDMQHFGEGLGDTVRTFRQAAADVRNAVDPQMRTIKAEMDAAQKEIEQSIEAAKQPPPPVDEPPKNA